ncbi:unnamed protein product [Ranitomeya imitator]|uniref:Tf2-1-like SH3-like domain-containing protein n=1 Tax=Ranitomeya imitator TaxID=111125 RepID=A0ABN9L504_9NEOB|nr:unnamed protein product [Ranitomeya imitator]
MWVVVDQFSKMCHLVPFNKLLCAKTLAKAFVKEIVRLYRVPTDIVSDRGPQIEEEPGRQAFSEIFVADNQEMSSEYLPLAEFALNNHVFHGWGGIHLSVHFQRLEQRCLRKKKFSGNLDRVLTNVHHNLKEANRRSKKYFDKKRREALFAVGDMVWLSSRNLCLKIPSKILGPKFVGPFKVVQVVNSATVRVDIPSSWRINSVFQVSLLKKVDTPDKEVMQIVPPVDEDGEFEISHILDSRWHRGRL